MLPPTKELLAKYRLYLCKIENKNRSVLNRHQRERLMRMSWRNIPERCLYHPADKMISWLSRQRGKAGSKMAQLITKSYTLRRRNKEKEEPVQIDKLIDEKATQLRYLPSMY